MKGPIMKKATRDTLIGIFLGVIAVGGTTKYLVDSSNEVREELISQGHEEITTYMRTFNKQRCNFTDIYGARFEATNAEGQIVTGKACKEKFSDPPKITFDK